jgi:hypothetical protein
MQMINSFSRFPFTFVLHLYKIFCNTLTDDGSFSSLTHDCRKSFMVLLVLEVVIHYCDPAMKASRTLVHPGCIVQLM